MAKDKLHELKNTTNSFQMRGQIVGTKSKRFYNSGNTKTGGNWASIEFGVKINEGKTVYLTLRGFPRDEVFYYKKGENGAKGTTQKVAWKDRHKAPSKDHRLIGINISTGKDEDGKNINTTMTEYDAVEWLHNNLNDNDSVFIKGNLQFSSYTDRNGQTKRKVELVPTQISYTNETINFGAEGFTEMCEFENTLVFSSIDQEMDENDKATGRFILSGYDIKFNSVEPVSFILDAEHKKLAQNIKKTLKAGYSIKTYGRVEVISDISVVEEADDGWGESSPMERLNSPVRREYIVYKADPNSIEKEDYSEDAIAAAIKKIKAAQEAAKNFGEKPTADSSADDSDWGSTDDDDGDEPW